MQGKVQNVILGADRLRRGWEKQGKIKWISRALILRFQDFKAGLIIFEGTIFECLTFARQETSKSAAFQPRRLKQLPCSAWPWGRQRFMFRLGFVYTVTWLNLDHKPAPDILARILHLHSNQTVFIGVAAVWQRGWAGNCKHLEVLTKSGLNLSSAGLDCGNASGLLQGKGTSINTAGTVQVNEPFSAALK